MNTSSLSLRGVFPALVTPFTADATAVDTDSLRGLVQRLLSAGVAGFVACGSTGEAATLTDSEYAQVLRVVREAARGAVPVVAGISVSSTARAVELAQVAHGAGMDGLLIATPPYNKPSQAGIREHFRALQRAVPLPLIAYNIPGRSAVAVAPTTVATLAQEGTIIGIKESSGSIDTIAELALRLPSSCQMVTGEDALTFALLAYGGVGAISAAANVLARELVEIVAACERGEYPTARRLQLQLLGRIKALFVESNPVPAKTVLALQGVIKHPTVRLPLTPLSSVSVELIKQEFSL
jgi:4-hydroxy-tetrahydrodipicolinate synthase